jgi:hypothetical protein
MSMSIERTKARLAIKIFSISAFLVLVLWGITPFLIPKSLIEDLASDAFGGKVFIEEMSLRPFGHQTIQNMQIEADLLYGSIEFLETDAGLWWILLFPSKTNILVQKPKMVFSDPKNQRSDEWEIELFSTPFLDIRHGSIQFNNTMVEPIQGSFQLQERAIFSSIELQFTTEGQTGSVKSSIDCHFKEDFFDEDEDFIKKTSMVDGHVEILLSTLPLTWSPLFTSLFGDQINGLIRLDFEDSLVANLHLNSPLLMMDMRFNKDVESLEFTHPSSFNYVVSNSLPTYFKQNFSIVSPASISGQFQNSKKWSIELKKGLKILAPVGKTLEIQSLNLDQQDETTTFMAKLIQPEGKGFISLNSKKGDIRFEGKNISTLWGTLNEHTKRLVEAGPLLQARGGFEEDILNFQVSGENLQVSNTSLKIGEDQILLLDPVTIDSFLGDYKIDTFVYKDEDIGLSLKGGGSKLRIDEGSIKAQLALNELIVEKKLGSKFSGSFNLLYTDLITPFKDQLSPNGSLMGSFGGDLKKLKIMNLELVSEKLNGVTSFEIEENFEEIESISTTKIRLFTKQGPILQGDIPSYKWKKGGSFEYVADLKLEKAQIENQPVLIEGGNVYLEGKKKKDQFNLKFSSNGSFISEESISGKFETKGSIELQNNELFSVSVHFDGKNLPLNALYPDLTLVVGPYLDAKIDVKGNERPKGAVVLENNFIRADLKGTISKEGFTLFESGDSSKIQYSLAPLKSFPFVENLGLKLDKTGNIFVECHSLFYPFDRETKKIEFVGTVEGKEISFSNETNSSKGKMRSFVAKVDKRALGPLHVHVDVSSSFEGPKKGFDVLGDSNFTLLWDPSVKDSFSVFTKFQNFPTLDLYNLGNSLNGTIFLDVSRGLGRAGIHLESTNIQIDGDGKVQSSNLYLTNAFTAKFKSLKVGRKEIKNLSSLQFSIPQKGAIIPLFPLDLEKILIPKIHVLPFMVSTKVEGNTRSVFSALNVGVKGNIPIYCVPICSENSRLSPEQRPACLSIVNGVCYLTRLDLLLDQKVWLILWGSTNVSTLDTTLYLGISGPTLYRTLGIANLSTNFVLPIKFSGSLENFKISKQDIVTAIAFLTAKIYAQQIAPDKGELNLDFLVDQQGVPPLSCPPSWLNR